MQLLSKIIKKQAVVEEEARLIGLRSREQVQSCVRDNNLWEQFVHESEAKAQMILAEAREEAEKIIQEARKQKEKIYSQVRDAARQEGYASALEDAREEATLIREEAGKVLEEAHQKRKKIIQGAQDELLELALKISEKIVEKQIELNRETVIDIVHKAVEKAVGTSVKVLVAPEDLGLVREHRDKLAESLSEEVNLSVEPDGSLKPGDCYVETEKSFVDASVETKLQQVCHTLRGEDLGNSV